MGHIGSHITVSLPFADDEQLTRQLDCTPDTTENLQVSNVSTVWKETPINTTARVEVQMYTPTGVHLLRRM